jgi:hypothetical protein
LQSASKALQPRFTRTLHSASMALQTRFNHASIALQNASETLHYCFRYWLGVNGWLLHPMIIDCTKFPFHHAKSKQGCWLRLHYFDLVANNSAPCTLLTNHKTICNAMSQPKNNSKPSANGRDAGKLHVQQKTCSTPCALRARPRHNSALWLLLLCCATLLCQSSK